MFLIVEKMSQAWAYRMNGHLRESSVFLSFLMKNLGVPDTVLDRIRLYWPPPPHTHTHSARSLAL